MKAERHRSASDAYPRVGARVQRVPVVLAAPPGHSWQPPGHRSAAAASCGRFVPLAACPAANAPVSGTAGTQPTLPYKLPWADKGGQCNTAGNKTATLLMKRLLHSLAQQHAALPVCHRDQLNCSPGGRVGVRSAVLPPACDPAGSLLGMAPQPSLATHRWATPEAQEVQQEAQVLAGKNMCNTPSRHADAFRQQAADKTSLCSTK